MSKKSIIVALIGIVCSAGIFEKVNATQQQQKQQYNPQQQYNLHSVNYNHNNHHNLDALRKSQAFAQNIDQKIKEYKDQKINESKGKKFSSAYNTQESYKEFQALEIRINPEKRNYEGSFQLIDNLHPMYDQVFNQIHNTFLCGESINAADVHKHVEDILYNRAQEGILGSSQRAGRIASILFLIFKSLSKHLQSTVTFEDTENDFMKLLAVAHQILALSSALHMGTSQKAMDFVQAMYNFLESESVTTESKYSYSNFYIAEIKNTLGGIGNIQPVKGLQTKESLKSLAFATIQFLDDALEQIKPFSSRDEEERIPALKNIIGAHYKAFRSLLKEGKLDEYNNISTYVMFVEFLIGIDFPIYSQNGEIDTPKLQAYLESLKNGLYSKVQVMDFVESLQKKVSGSTPFGVVILLSCLMNMEDNNGVSIPFSKNQIIDNIYSSIQGSLGIRGTPTQIINAFKSIQQCYSDQKKLGLFPDLFFLISIEACLLDDKSFNGVQEIQSLLDFMANFQKQYENLMLNNQTGVIVHNINIAIDASLLSDVRLVEPIIKMCNLIKCCNVYLHVNNNKKLDKAALGQLIINSFSAIQNPTLVITASENFVDSYNDSIKDQENKKNKGKTPFMIQTVPNYPQIKCFAHSINKNTIRILSLTNREELQRLNYDYTSLERLIQEHKRIEASKARVNFDVFRNQASNKDQEQQNSENPVITQELANQIIQMLKNNQQQQKQ